MNIKELMIGNIIQDEKGNYFRVDGLADDRVRTTADGVRWYMPVIFSGIPITEEILSKCGFELNHDTFMGVVMGKKVLEHWIGLKNNGDYFILSNPHTNTRIAYLHQLQNLYFSITNKELEVKL